MSESGQVTANEEEVPPTEEATVTRRWMVIKDPSILPLKDAIVINNLEFMIADAKIGLRSSKASSRRSSDASGSSRRSSRADEVENANEEDFIAGKHALTYVKRTKNTLDSASKFREAALGQVKDLWDAETVVARGGSTYIELSKRVRAEKATGKGKGKGKQVETITASFHTNMEREESQETEVNTPRRRSSKRKVDTPGGARQAQRRNVLHSSEKSGCPHQ
ncbi:hypothetical protein ACHAPJ_003419 [Fusarium lateritium]